MMLVLPTVSGHFVPVNSKNALSVGNKIHKCALRAVYIENRLFEIFALDATLKSGTEFCGGNRKGCSFIMAVQQISGNKITGIVVNNNYCCFFC